MNISKFEENIDCFSFLKLFLYNLSEALDVYLPNLLFFDVDRKILGE
jgi:hypothetical protein